MDPMRFALALGGILIAIGSLLSWATFNDLFLQYFVELTGLDLGHGLLTALAGVWILLISSDGAMNLVAARSWRAALFLSLVALSFLPPPSSGADSRILASLAAIAFMLIPSPDAIRRVARRPERAAVALALLVLADLAVVVVGLVLHDPDVDELLFEGIGVGLILVAVGAAIAAVAGLQREVAIRRS
jgi:undecaprenyl pyrophosphate phosphatase UppP